MFDIERNGEEHRKLSYNDINCVGCGICTNVCPTSSLRLGPIVPIARGLIEMDLADEFQFDENNNIIQIK